MNRQHEFAPQLNDSFLATKIDRLGDDFRITAAQRQMLVILPKVAQKPADNLQLLAGFTDGF